MLWRSQADDPKAGPSGQSLSRVTPTWYGRHELTTSDHRPVGAALTVAVAVAVAERRRAVQNEILRSLDAWENECGPPCNPPCNPPCSPTRRWLQAATLCPQAAARCTKRRLISHPNPNPNPGPNPDPKPDPNPYRCMPMAQLQTHELSYDAVRFGQPARLTLPLRNVGQTTLQFSFQPLPQACNRSEARLQP